MTRPQPGDGSDAAEWERRLADKAEWHYVAGLAERVAELEQWRAGLDAVAARRRWAWPVAVSVLGLAASAVNVADLLLHHH